MVKDSASSPDTASSFVVVQNWVTELTARFDATPQ